MLCRDLTEVIASMFRERGSYESGRHRPKRCSGTRFGVSLKFRRQHPIGPFVADFCCPDRRLVVEVDGGIHDSQLDHDAEREALLIAAGYRVLRIRNEAVMNHLPSVLEQIRTAAFGQRLVPPAERSRTGGW